jgi:hypothetical protein
MTAIDSRVKQLIATGDGLFSDLSQWNNMRQETAELFYPMRSDFTGPLPIGTDFQSGLMDSFPVQARDTLGNMPHAMTRQGSWFSVSTGDDEFDKDHENTIWFEKSRKAMRRVMYATTANFVAATIENDQDYVTFGNGILSVEENASRSGLIYKAHHPRDVVWMVNADGKIDHVQRTILMSARNVCRKWKGNVHPDIEKIAQDKPNDKVKIRHILMPMDEIYGDDRKALRKYKRHPFLSAYIDIDHQCFLGQSGMPVFNYIISGWRKLSNVMPAFSPATLNCLPDSRMLQSLARILLEQGEKALDPPIAARGEIFRDAVNLYAGGLTYVDLESDQSIQDVLHVLENKGQLSFGMEMKQDVRELIADSMLLNKLFLPPVDKEKMTAFETNARLDEVRRAALPFFGPYDSECNLPLCEVTFEMMVNAKAIPPTPEALDGTDITFRFEGPLNTLEGRQAVQAHSETIAIITSAAALDKSIAADYDLRTATQDAVRGTGAKPEWFVDKEQADQAKQDVADLDDAATAIDLLSGGAQAAGAVADTTLKLQQAGAV